MCGGRGLEVLSSSSELLLIIGKKRMDTLALTILNYYITNRFHYFHINVILIFDLHQATQWFPPRPLAN